MTTRPFYSVTFGEKNTWDEWKLMPVKEGNIEFVSPPVKEEYAEVAGMDGDLDMSEVLTGYPTYENRKGSLKFRFFDNGIAVRARYTALKNYLHGKAMRAYVIDEPEYYYEGRFTVGDLEYAHQGNWADVTIGYNVKPYKNDLNTTTEDWLWNPFNFETGVIRDYGDIVSHGGVTVGFGGDYGVLCPICGGLTSINKSESGVEVLVCDNENCPGKLAQRIDHYCSKKGMDIKGLSRKTIEKLIDWGWINDNISELYDLQSHRTEWISKPGFGAASVDKILDAIEGSKKNADLGSFISGLGIPLVGQTIAREIIKYCSTWDDFKDMVGGDWTVFDGFGTEISKALNEFDYSEADKIAAILDFSLPETKVESGQEAVAPAIQDKTFCITGKLKTFKNRDELKFDITSLGGKVTDSISSKTDYLINNDINSTSSKNNKAKQLGIPIISEEDYINLKNKQN